MSDWQLIADLSFADLILWAPTTDGRGWLAMAQMRPTTGPTSFPDDVVGTTVEPGERTVLDTARTAVRSAAVAGLAATAGAAPAAWANDSKRAAWGTGTPSSSARLLSTRARAGPSLRPAAMADKVTGRACSINRYCSA